MTFFGGYDLYIISPWSWNEHQARRAAGASNTKKCIANFTFSVMFAAMQLQPYDDGNFKEFHSVNLKMCKLMSDILEKEEPSRRDLEETDELLNQWTRHVESCVAVAQV